MSNAILFHDAAVRRLCALPAGSVVVTVRPVMPQPEERGGNWHWKTRGTGATWTPGDLRRLLLLTSPYGPAGATVWAREHFAPNPAGDPERPYIYRADFPPDALPEGVRWGAPIHMPVEAGRLRFRLVEQRALRLHEVTPALGWVEGFQAEKPEDARAAFREEWDTLWRGRKLGWDRNPWVRALILEREG